MVIAIMLINIILTATPMKNGVFCSHAHATHLNQKTEGLRTGFSSEAEPQQEQIGLYACEHKEEESSREKKERGCHISRKN